MKSIIVFSTALLFAVGFSSCGNRYGGNQAVDDPEAHDESLQLAAYNDRFELFAEASPFVAGETSHILAHFTQLENFKPLEGGTVTANLTVGSESVRQTIEIPVRPGIYEFELLPTVAGDAQLVFDITTPEGISQLAVSGLHVYTDGHEAGHAAADAAVSSPAGVSFTKEQSWKVDFATEEVRMEPFGEIIKTTAQILPSQEDERVITSRAAGVVTFSSGDMTPGRSVDTGQALFSLESGGGIENNLSVRYGAAVSEYNRAKAEYERKKTLAAERIVSQSDLLRAETEYRDAETVYNDLRATFPDGRQTVTSPIDGTLKQLFVANDQYVEAGQPLAVVSRNRTLLVQADLPPRYYPVLGSITTANLRVMNSGRVYTLEELNGRVLSYGKSAGTDNPLVPVVFRVNNSAGLLPGSFVQMYIKTQTNLRALTVPNEAIVEEMGSYFVYVQLTPEYFEKRPVRTGATDGFRTQLFEGVGTGERVVSRGAIFVKLSQASGALDVHSGHVH